MEKIIYSLVFLFPFFFLPLTQEFFVTNKLYLLGFGSLFLLLISTIQLLLTKRISWKKNPFDNLILLFLTSVAISTLFSSPNKIQALLNPNFGLVMMISLTILYFYLSRLDVRVGFSDPKEGGMTPPLQVISIVLSLITIILYFQPFKNISLPQNFAFLKNPGFTPVGSQLDLAILLGFFVVVEIVNILKKREKTSPLQSIIHYLSSIILPLLALFLTVYSLINLILPPFRLSWFAVLEILKNPRTALIGIGPDNFSSIFTRVKDFAYNQSLLWQINSFNVSHSAILQILTETGIFGLLTFGLLVFNVFRKIISYPLQPTPYNLSFLYLLICLFVFPPSLIVWFLFFVILGLINRTTTNSTDLTDSTDLTNLLPIYLGTILISLLLIGASGYFLGRSYLSEFYFKKSIDGINKNNLKEVYDNQRQAIILNPFIERFRSNFSQTNLVIANNLSSKIKDNKISETDRQNITQAIQAGIAEAKAVVSLNPQRADGWQNLASIYLNIINVVKDADVWTISAYQRAIIADPQNPTYRIGLGGVYYSQKKYEDALRFFEQAVSIKPDWPNAVYNYAWANFQLKKYPEAVNALQNTLNLINSKTNKADYEKVQKELEEFKKMLPKEEVKNNNVDKQNKSNLNLPTPPTTEINPKLELQKEASPEAK
jgi:tetratricopeptide (TPR) repeat protein